MDEKKPIKLRSRSGGYYWDDAQLRRINQRRKPRVRAVALGQVASQLWKKKIVPLQKKFGWLAEAWEALLPEELRRHSCLESFSRGSLKVLVDSDAHYYELNLLLREGLTDRIRQMCPRVSLTEIRLTRGMWYSVDEEGRQIGSLTESRAQKTEHRAQ